MKRRFDRLILLTLLMSLALCLTSWTPATAQSRFYGDGILEFSYLCSNPLNPFFDNYTGDFRSEGGLASLVEFPPVGILDQATVALLIPDSDSGQTTLVIVGCVANNDTEQSCDVSMLTVVHEGAMDAGDYTAQFLYLDDAQGHVDLDYLLSLLGSVDDPVDIVLPEITAEYSYGGFADLTLTDVTGSVTGSFNAVAADAGGTYGLLTTDGQFDTEFTTVPLARLSLGAVKVMFR